MLQELQEKLYQKYPDIFVQNNYGQYQSTIYCEITCGDGWYNLIDRLCGQIMSHVVNHNNYIDFKIKQGKVNDLPEKLDAVKAVQVKEKFGGLRFYVSGGDERIDGAISMAESISYCICETCGNKGSQTKVGWIRTLCENCLENHKNRTF